MNPLRPKITDGRGVNRPLLPPLNPHDRRHPQRLQRALDATRPWAARRTLISVAALALVTLLAVVVIPALMLLDRVPFWAVLFAAAPAGFVTPIASLILERLLHSESYRAAYLCIGLCPSCGYDIGTAPDEDDGCRACPECGGAWRVVEHAREEQACGRS